METENAMAEEAEVVEDSEITEETQAEEETTEEVQAEEEVPKGVKERLAKMSAQKGQFEREKETALRKAHELAQEKVELAERAEAAEKALEEFKSQQKTEGRPKLEDFETDEDFYVAMTDWKWDQRDLKAKEEREQAQQTQTREQAETAYREKVVNTNKNGAEKYEDYEEVVFSLPGDVMSSEMASAIFETDAPEDIAYHLGKNPKEAAKIAKLSPLKKAIALGKIEARLTTKKTTNAPPPITPVKGKTSSTFDPDKLLAENPREWIKLRNEGKI